MRLAAPDLNRVVTLPGCSLDTQLSSAYSPTTLRKTPAVRILLV
jgi:hypothetical protein